MSATIDQVLEEVRILSLKVDGLVHAQVTARAPQPSAAGGAPTTLPGYGRSKGMPIAGASKQDLDFYINGCKRSLADPAKERWRAKEQALLSALEAELARQSGGAPAGPASADGDAEAPF